MEMLTIKEQATIEDVATIFGKLTPENKNKFVMVGFGMLLANENERRKSINSI